MVGEIWHKVELCCCFLAGLQVERRIEIEMALCLHPVPEHSISVSEECLHEFLWYSTMGLNYFFFFKDKSKYKLLEALVRIKVGKG